MKSISHHIMLCAMAAVAANASARTSVDYSATALGQGSTGDFAPYFIGALNNGRTTRADAGLLDLEAHVAPDLSRRFTWSAGVELITGWQSATDYARFSDGSWSTTAERPAALWVQQLYASVKYRGVFLRVGQQDPHSALLDESLSSGDLTRSSNARGIPGAEIGFIDFQDIPFTDGWVQIDGVIEYGRMTDSDFISRQFNHYNGVETSALWYTYKRCYFRTKPSQPLSFTLGMQSTGQFAGSSVRYRAGQVVWSEDRGFHVSDLWKMFFPVQGHGSDGYYEGNSLGTWDFKARYRFNDGRELSFAFQWPWEDGSGIGRRNGWDGLWGLYYTAPGTPLVAGAAVEYLDFRNQSGPIHWAPGDFPGTDNTAETTGADDYYNNEAYGAFANYGMAIATPFLVSPLYNLNGSPAFMHNRARGFHLALKGFISPVVSYTLKYSRQQAWGTGRIPSYATFIDNSMLASFAWDASALVRGLSLRGSLAFDAGSLRGDNFGMLVGITYSGSLTLIK